eukprot:gene3342-4190_t
MERFKNKVLPPSSKDQVKIQYQIKIKQIEGLSKSIAGPLVISWKRGSKAENTGEVKVSAPSNGQSIVNHQIMINATLEKNSKGVFQEKTMIFSVREEKAKKSMGSMTLNLAQYTEGTEKTHLFPVKDKSKIFCNINISILPQWLKLNGKTMIKAEGNQKEILTELGKQHIQHEGGDYFLQTEQDISDPEQTDLGGGHDSDDDEDEVSFEDDNSINEKSNVSTLSRKSSTLSSGASDKESPSPLVSVKNESNNNTPTTTTTTSTAAGTSSTSSSSSDAKIKKLKKKIKTLKLDLEKSQKSVGGITKDRDEKVEEIKKMFDEMETIRDRSKSVGNGVILEYTNQIDSLKSENAELKDHLQRERNQTNKDSKEIEKLQNQIISLTNQVDGFGPERAALLSNIRDLEQLAKSSAATDNTELNNAKESIRVLQNELNNLRVNFANLQEENKGQFIQIEEERLKSNANESNANRIQQENTNLQQQLEHFERVINTQTDASNAEKEKLEKEIEQLKEQISSSAESKSAESESNEQRIKELEESVSKLEQSKKEIEQSKDESIQELNQEISKLKETVSSLKESGDSAQQTQEQTISELKEQLEKLNEEKQRLGQSREDLDKNQKEQRSQLKDLKKEIEELTKSNQDLTETHQKLNQDYELIIKEKSQLNDKIQELEQLSSARKESEEELERLRESNEKLENELQEQKSKQQQRDVSSSGSNQVEEMENTIRELTDQIDQLKDQLNNQPPPIDIPDDYEELKEKVNKYKSKCEHYKHKINNYKDLISKTEEDKEIQNIESSMHQSQEIQEQKSQIQELEHKIGRQTEEIDVYQDEIRHLKNQLSEVKEESSHRNNLVTEYQTLIDQLQSDLHNANQEKDQLSTELTETRELLEDRNNRDDSDNSSSEDEDRLAKYKEKIEHQKEKIKSLKEELESKEDEWIDSRVQLDQTISNLEEEKTKLQSQLEDALNNSSSDHAAVVIPPPLNGSFDSVELENEIHNLKLQIKSIEEERDAEQSKCQSLELQLEESNSKLNNLSREMAQQKSSSPSIGSPQSVRSSNGNEDDIKRELEEIKNIETCIYWPEIDFDRNNVPYCGTSVWQMIDSIGGLAKSQNQRMLTKIVYSLEKSFLRSGNDCKFICYWLSTVVHLLHKIHQSGLTPASSDPSKSGIEISISNFVSASPEIGGSFVRDLQTLVLNIYSKLISIVEMNIEKVLISSIFIPDSIILLSQKSPLKTSSSNSKPTNSINNLLSILDSIIVFLRDGRVADTLSNQLLNQVFYFINAQITNYLLSHPKVCTTTQGLEVKMGVSRLKEWCSQTNYKSASQQLDSSHEASNLLVIDKSVFVDIEAIKSIFQRLNLHQIKQLLESYTPDDLSPDPLPISLKKAIDMNWRQSDIHNQPLQIDASKKLSKDSLSK